MAVVSLMGAAMALTLPETAGEELSAVSEVPETQYGSDQSDLEISQSDSDPSYSSD